MEQQTPIKNLYFFLEFSSSLEFILFFIVQINLKFMLQINSYDISCWLKKS